MKWTDDNLDVLQNLEFSVAEVWRAHPEMSDYAALRAYEAAFQFYRAEQRGGTPKPVNLAGLDFAAFDAVKMICEFAWAARPARRRMGKRFRQCRSKSCWSACGNWRNRSNATPSTAAGRAT